MSGDIDLDVKAFRGELPRQMLAGVKLVVADLRMGVNIQRELLVDGSLFLGVLTEDFSGVHGDAPLLEFDGKSIAREKSK